MPIFNKARFEKWLIHSPFLRLLWYEHWFRLAFILLFLIFGSLGLVLPKIWRLSPAGFLPVVRISGLDWLQAWSLKRSALKWMREGQPERAAYCWRAAIANHPASAELFRGSLRNYLQCQSTNASAYLNAVGQTIWLLRLTQTNRTDLELASKIWDTHQLYELVIEVAGPRRQEWTAPVRAVYLKALFHLGQIDSFAELWNQLPETERIDPQLSLYHAAYALGWGPTEQMTASRNRLRAALDDPAQRVLAARLQLAVAGYLEELRTYAQMLDRLQAWEGDSLLDHIGYWRLLVRNGRSREAAELARGLDRPAQSPLEARRWAEVLVQVGLADEALKRLGDGIGRFPYSGELWIQQAQLLINEKRWEQLQGLSLQLRLMDQAPAALMGISYFWEGLSELGQRRAANAAIVFEKLKVYPLEPLALRLGIVETLLDYGYCVLAQELLADWENAFRGNARYWRLRFLAAYLLKQVEPMSLAAARAYELEPGNLGYANNYAASLLLRRQQPAEAISLTLRMLQAQPDSVAAKVNHSLALLLNHRTPEAARLLKTINPDLLLPAEARAYHLAWFEVFYRQADPEHAEAMYQRIDRDQLLPHQLEWLNQARAAIHARTQMQP